MDWNNAPIFLSLKTSLMDLSDTGAIDYCVVQGAQKKHPPPEKPETLELKPF